MTSFSVYPNDIDGYSTLPLRRDGVHEIRADDYNRLRDAAVKIEQELGVQPSGTYATVRDRLDDIGDAATSIAAHLVDPVDAHDASAISVLDTGDNYVSEDVEGALGELASVLPVSLDTVGRDNVDIPNTGIPDFISGAGRFHVFNTGAAGTVLQKTQPITTTGVHIIDVGTSNGAGTGAELRFTPFPARLSWKAPGDAFGTDVDISGLSAGEIATLSSSDSTKQIRIARSSASLPGIITTDTFEVIRFDRKDGYFSLPGVGFKNTVNITRAAAGDTETTRNQFMLSGMVFPADKGTLVLQRKLRLNTDEFTPIATLDLRTNFNESFRESGQPVYVPSLSDFDTITLYDRLPARKDYDGLTPATDGYVYDNLDLSATFVPFQMARYLIPISNSSGGLNGTLESPTAFSGAEIQNKVSAYRLVHYLSDVTDFNGNPNPNDIFSLSDEFTSNDGDNNVRFSNVWSDSNTTRPTIDQVLLRPFAYAVGSSLRRSGIAYYSTSVFDFEVKTNTNLFNNAYTRNGTLKVDTNLFNVPTGFSAGNYGPETDLDEMFDDGYVLFSDSNLPAFNDNAFYLINSSFNTIRRFTPAAYSNDAFVTVSLRDPFGYGASVDAYGYDNLVNDTQVRLLLNPNSLVGATDTQEFFTDESKRLGTSEAFGFALDRDQFTGSGSGGTLAGWTNTTPLAFGDLQVGGIFSNRNVPGLNFPQDDYSGDVLPTQQAGVNYSVPSYEVDSTYQRLFSLGFTTNGGQLRIKSGGHNLLSYNDIDASNSTRPLKIEVKVPGTGNNSTGFLDLGRLFETGQVTDGYGAVAGPIIGGTGDFTVPFTFGVVNTADTGFMIAVRVTYFSSPVSVLNDAKTKILQLLELLSP